LPTLLAVLLASACAGDDSATVTVTVTTNAAPTEHGEWEGLPQPLPVDGGLPVDEFNAHAESVQEPWERDLAATVNEFIGETAADVQNISFQATTGPEGAGPAKASLLLDGLLDDSVRARRYDVTLSRRQDRTWRIDAASWAQRCQQGRGHQSFSPDPCL
jgi:hypothetical protein